MNTHVVPRIDFIDVERLATGMRLELDWIVPGARHAGDRNKRAHRLMRRRAAKRDSEIKRYRERSAPSACGCRVSGELPGESIE
jgi:hypothetical protein